MSWIAAFEGLRRPLGTTPTALEFHRTLSDELGVRLFLKREDRIDDLASGNKVRKLEYFLGQAALEDADTLISAGSAQSNQCRAIATIARQLGYDSHIVFCDPEPPTAANGSYLLDLLFGDRWTWVDASEWPRIEERLEEVRAQEEDRGSRPFVLPPGASAWPGTLGYVRMALELAGQEEARSLGIDHIVVPTGSGGTHAGLVVGKELAGRPWQITAVCILGDRPYFERRHASILEEMAARGGLELSRAMRQIDVFDGAVGGGYASYEADDLDEMIRVVKSHGVLFGPTYMLKALRGLRELIECGSIRRGSTVVLVHTGGQYEIFGQGRRLEAHLNERFARWLWPEIRREKR